ncbi:hypothetical protein [Mycolicibacterium sp. CR10]|uniref:hypothetical protein n=1 Tax=Mycolicibacterium sp. CR10 TaxID=2562314 RepID=UPI0010BFA709|nr:hypothetical protein [Mycolicibacterium sp. CR10]
MTTPTTPVLDVVHQEVPPVAPAAIGLYAATEWLDDPANRSFNGVEFRGPNYGGENAFGIWEGHYCSAPQPGQIKDGHRPGVLPPFRPVVVWSYDECDLTAPSQAEVRARAAQILKIEEQTAIELEFANRLIEDATALPGTIPSAASLKEAVGSIEGALAKTNTVGYIHISAALVAQEPGLFIGSGTVRKSPLGHTWVVGGGYVDGLASTLVATSRPYGFRDAPAVRTAIDEKHNVFAAIAERSVLIGYEAAIAAATVTS